MPADIIDLRIGEARAIRDITLSIFDINNVSASFDLHDWEYQSHGYAALVKFLEEKHSAPVIITNGANQALHAAMYALKHRGYNNLGFRTPFWNRVPEIAKHIGIKYTPFVGNILADKKLNIDSYLLTMPNNPDGHLPTLETIRMVSAMLKEQKIPLIHDAVYYTRSYLPVDHPIENVGDLQIFSASKSYGLSSLRIGYIVVHNSQYYDDLLDFVELTTVGVSVASQKLFLRILQREEELPFLKSNFEKLTRDTLKKAKSLFKSVNSEYIDLPDNFEQSCGVFAWVKPKVSNIFELAGVEVLPGNLFGMPDYCRLNLAAGNDMIAEVVNRINSQ